LRQLGYEASLPRLTCEWLLWRVATGREANGAVAVLLTAIRHDAGDAAALEEIALLRTWSLDSIGVGWRRVELGLALLESGLDRCRGRNE
jgi:hypothetical protein